MDTRDLLRISCSRLGALPGCFCKSQSGAIFTLQEERRLVRRRARGRKSPLKGPRQNRRIERMRLIRLLLSISLLALVSAAQEGTSTPGQSPSGASKSGPSKSIEGCLTSSNGSYTLGTLSGDLYQLENSGHDLRKYNGQEVRITGRVTPPHPGSSPSNVLDQQYAKLKVQKIKKVFDTCQ